VFTPLAYGTVEPWSEAIAELVVLGMVVAWIVGMLGDWELRVELPLGWLPASLFLALVFFQATPLPPALIGLVSPWTTGLYAAAVAYTGNPLASVPLSLAPYVTLHEALKLGAVAAFFLVCYNVYRTSSQVRRAIWTMIAVGAFISLFGIIQRVAWNGRFYWLGPEAPGGSAFGPFGPFVNRAHFVSVMTVIVPMALALWIGSRRATPHRRFRVTWKDQLRIWNSYRAGPVSLVPVLVLVMGGASLVSGSRGGMVAFLVTLLCMVMLRSKRDGATVKLLGVTALIVMAGVWVGGQVVFGTVERLVEEAGDAESPRLQIWLDSLGFASRTAFMGTGLGTFGSVYPLTRTVRAPVTFSHAESDVVQTVTDTGLVGATLAVAVVICLVCELLRRRAESEINRSPEFALAAVAVLVGALVGGTGNYTLPVMAYHLLLMMAVVLGMANRKGATT
jgi:O-antigen ligase